MKQSDSGSALAQALHTGHAAHNFAVLHHIALNLIRLAPVQHKGGIKVRRLIAATSDTYRAQLLGLVYDSCNCPVVDPIYPWLMSWAC